MCLVIDCLAWLLRCFFEAPDFARYTDARRGDTQTAMMAAKRPPPEETHYYAMTGGSRAVNVKFTPAPRPTRKAYPKYVAGGPIKSCVPGSLVLADGTILPPREPSRLVKAAMMKRFVKMTCGIS